MLIYYALLAYPALFALLSAGRSVKYDKWHIMPMVGFWVLYNFISAIRDNTGGDWYTYDEITYLFTFMTLQQALAEADPGFAVVGWVGIHTGLGLYFTNFVCSAILSFGVLRLAYRLPNPWLAIAAAVPYLLIVVGFGYIRQGAAIGLMISAICSLQDRKHLMAVLQMAVAISFHVSAVAMAPLLIFAVLPKNIWTLSLVVAGTLVLADVMMSTQIGGTYQTGYIEASYQSSGATVRIVMNIVPAAMFMALRKQLNISKRERQIWEIFAWASIALFVGLVTSQSSTAVDRLALYLMPVQVFVFGIFVPAIAGPGRPARLVALACLAYIALVQSVWLFYADHAFLWVPFQSIFDEIITPMVLRDYD